MKYLRKIIYILFLIISMFIFAGYVIPKKITIEKTLDCFEEISGKRVTVIISGIYYSYLLRDDCFNGTINVENKRVCTMEYHLRKDLYTNFVDEYGQPEGGIVQFKEFSYICIDDLDYYLYNEWNPEWNKEFKKKEAWNNKIRKIKEFFKIFRACLISLQMNKKRL